MIYTTNVIERTIKQIRRIIVMEDRFELAVIGFIEGYKKVLQKKGNTLRYTIKNIYLLLEDRYLWGEGLHIFIDMVENRKDELPVGKLLKDIYVTNLIPENYPLDSYEEKGLEIIEGLAIVVLCQENGHVKQREIAEFIQLPFSD
jgi:hypothetical protein